MEKGNTINIYGNVTNSQIQQDAQYSRQFNRRSGQGSFGIGLEASIMLLYATEDEENGEIIISRTLSGTDYCAGKWTLNLSQNRRELARWEEAKDQLLSHRYIKPIGHQGVIFEVTAAGIRVADDFKETNQLDTDKSPAELIIVKSLMFLYI